jgi:glycosyltransferase involved in cell wall biosynthesis
MPEMVSCLCVTKGRPQLKEAIECFNRQLYPNKELIIVVDGQESISCNQPDVKVYNVNRNTLGELRQASVNRATGHIVLQWDDDDLYHPDRIDCQVNSLVKSDKSFGLLAKQIIEFEGGYYLVHNKGFHGTLCAYREQLPEYEKTSVGEDTYILDWEDLVTCKEEVYIRRYHGKNLCSREHYLDIINRYGVKQYTPNEYKRIKADYVSSIPTG